MHSRVEEDSDAYPLGPALSFMRHVWALNHALERLSNRMERTVGVTAQQRLLLRCIGKCPGITAGQLAGALHVDPGTISASLRRLVDRGLVERCGDVRDKRRVVLVLTAEARALDRPTVGTVEHAVRQLLEETSAADAATTATVLTRLSRILERTATAPSRPAGSSQKKRVP